MLKSYWILASTTSEDSLRDPTGYETIFSSRESADDHLVWLKCVDKTFVDYHAIEKKVCVEDW
jgi:hypothetical protein